MLKFNNDNIFTGHIKQLLASFDLPKCRVYTEEQREYHERYLRDKKKAETLRSDIATLTTALANAQEGSEDYAYYKQSLDDANAALAKLATTPELNVLASCFRNDAQEYSDYNSADGELASVDYPRFMRYLPYIKDGELQIYAPKISDGEIVYSDDDWKAYHLEYGKGHSALHKKESSLYAKKHYSYGVKIRNYTKRLKISNNVYDSYTHEYLGDYLRFHRDYLNVDLMPLYNCFSDRVCPRLDLRFNVRNDNSYVAEFSTADRGYKIYMVPVRLFKDYTIAIDSEDAVEMCCGLFGQYQYESDYDVIAKNTYACFSSMQFKTPVLYEGIRNLDALSKLTSVPELAQHEDDLKLFIKIPAKNKSSIVILEGNYTKYNDSVACRYADEESTTVLRKQMPQTLRTQPKYVLERLGYVRDANGNDGKKATNHSVINFEYDCESLANKLITPLQLLKFNTGVSYPFADRLIEYLVGNAVTPMDEIGDNVKRVKTVVGKNLNKDVLKLNDEDIWEAPMRLVLYDYINDKYNVDDVNHDILGFVDKDVEKLYSASAGDSVDTIASVDIYDDWED